MFGQINMKIPEETRAYFRTPLKHPGFFVILYLPAVISFIVACQIYRFKIEFLLFPLVWCFFVGTYLIKGVVDGRLTDNHGTAIRKTMPARFWGKVAIWTFAYVFAMTWAIGFAVQERNKEKTEQISAGDVATRAAPEK
jgi:peptidoglycan/LPS O-acetylase OafA/YrhL